MSAHKKFPKLPDLSPSAHSKMTSSFDGIRNLNNDVINASTMSKFSNSNTTMLDPLTNTSGFNNLKRSMPPRRKYVDPQDLFAKNKGDIKHKSVPKMVIDSLIFRHLELVLTLQTMYLHFNMAILNYASNINQINNLNVINVVISQDYKKHPMHRKKIKIDKSNFSDLNFKISDIVNDGGCSFSTQFTDISKVNI